MSSALRPSTIDDEAQIIELLTRVFSADADAAFVNPALLRWKYWEQRDDFSGSRSFVVEKNGRIVAHVGLWPVLVQTGAHCEQGVQMIDWASDRSSPGAGFSLLQRLTKDFDFVYSIGGSAMTETLLPKFGFHVAATAITYARPIRPWRQILEHQSRNARLPLRLARNLWWSIVPGRSSAQGWEAVEAAAETNDAPAFSKERTASFFQYLERCPSVRLLRFHLLNGGKKVGFFAIALVAYQARLAGMWLDQPTQENWRIAFHVAQDVALHHTSAAEIVARTAAETSGIAATEAGLRVHSRTPVYLFRRAAGGDGLPLQFQLLDDDAVFLGGRRPEFLT